MIITGVKALFLQYKREPDPQILTRILEFQRTPIYAVCSRVLRHAQDAEDACQEVLFKVASEIDSLEDPECLEGWIYRVALHMSLDLRRRRAARKLPMGRLHDQDVETGESFAMRENLEEGLSGLDVSSRMLVTEYFLGEKTLRQLAASRGCSEQAVWKKLRKAKDRLKKNVHPSVVALTMGRAFPIECALRGEAACGPLTSKGATTLGGLAMGKTAMMIAAALLVALVGGGVIVRRVASTDGPRSLSTDGRGIRTFAKESSSSSMPGIPNLQPSDRIPKVPASMGVESILAGRARPYPYKVPQAHWSDAAKATFAKLHSVRIDLDMQNVFLPDLVRYISEISGIRIELDPGLDHSESAVIIKVTGIVLDGCLRLLLGPRGMAYEVRSDGVVLVSPKDNIRGDYGREMRDIEETMAQANEVHEQLDKGWNGQDVRFPEELDLKNRKVPKDALEAAGSGTPSDLRVSLEEVLSGVEKATGIRMAIDSQLQGLGTRTLLAGDLGIGGEPTVEDYVARLCGLVGLSYILGEDAVLLTTTERSLRETQRKEQDRAEYAAWIQSLSRDIGDVRDAGVPELMQVLEKSLGIPVVPTERAWASADRFSFPEGFTARSALEKLASSGFRWAIYRGKLFILN